MYNDPNTNYVMALYRPHPGREEETKALLDKHYPTLREAGLVTEQPVLILQSADGTFIEIFEWNGPDASRKAHEHPAIREIWGRMEEILELTTLSTLPEVDKRFPAFRRV